jgi:ABC-type histidine transport system ATPase subunit
MDEGPVVTIILLGNAECGKSTFLRSIFSQQPQGPEVADESDLYSRLSQGKDGIANASPTEVKLLRDID